jgi:5-methylcytosine-specific restriction endonuclease McrA
MGQSTMGKPKSKRKPIPPRVAAAVYRRDLWLCRWCKKPVILPQAVKLLNLELKHSGWTAPLALFDDHWSRAGAPLLDELGATVDHVKAHILGGPHEIENFVTACARCNARKSSTPLDEWEARNKPKPVRGSRGEPIHWDGLSSLFVILAKRTQHELTTTDRLWLKELAPLDA